MAERMGYGLIGCGEIAVQTSKAIAGSDVARVVHCTDPVRSVAEDLAAAHGAKATERLEDLLADPEVTAVVISVPHYLHAPLTLKAIEAGKHVLVEKPIACTLAQADQMIEAARAAGVKLGVLFPARFAVSAEKARELVAAGAIGKVIAVKLHAMSNKPAHYWRGGYTGRVKSDWRVALEKSGGGFLIMNMIHNLDTIVSIVDPRPARIYAEYGTFRTQVEVEDYISFVMRLEDGAVVSLDGSSAAVGGGSFGDHIYGQKGQLSLEKNLRVYLEEPFEGMAAGEWISLDLAAPPRGGRAHVVDGFARAVSGDGGPPVDGVEGRRSLEIVRGAYLSMTRGGPVEFPVRE